MGKHKRKRDSYDESESDRSRSRKARNDHNERNPKHSKKSKRKRSKSFKRDSSTESSASSASSTNSMKLLKRLQVERERILIERKKQKESLKASETPEEKRLRRLLKKELKERKRKERMGWDNDYLTYTNTDNPFGDSNLLETFVWKKKLEKLGLDSVSEEELARCTRQKQEENKRELEKVKKRRQEREAERASREDELALLQRQKEAAQFREWEKQEDYFHLQQARMRSQIRIQDGRAKPIDLLAKYISAEEEVDSIEMHEPYTCLAGLDMSDLEDLLEDIRVYKELEKGRNLSFWNDITIIVEDEVAKVRRIEASSREDSIGGRREGIHSAVTTDVSSIFKGKTHEQLLDLQNSISEKINNHAEGLDISYWESVLSQLNAHMARVRLRDRHQSNLRSKLEVLKAEQGMAAAEVPSSPQSPVPLPKQDQDSPVVIKTEEEERPEDGPEAVLEEDGAEDQTEESNRGDIMIEQSLNDYEAGRYSPKYVPPSEMEANAVVLTEDEDFKRMEFLRAQVMFPGVHGASSSAAKLPMTSEEKVFQKEAKKGMTDEEAQFSVEAALEQKVYLWSDKYRPRKPRYFNRVHTGFEWNKYNQTHYDMDNPPPKIVQGYKFNIFYPDLIDKNSTPEYCLIPCSDNRDFSILKFHAGPPYEDIAFKIVNREWEYSYKRGFRCQFQNNIFQLWFHFKRYRYRR